MNVLDQPRTSQEIEELILQEYDFYPQNIENEGHVKIIHCNRGSFVLKKTEATEEQLAAMDQMFHHLKEQQFMNLVPFFPNKYGDSFMFFNQQGYYVMPWLEDKMEEKYKDGWEKRVLGILGRLHQLTRRSSHGYSPSLSPKKLLQRWHLRLVQMNEYKKFAEDRPMMSPVELVFVTHFDYLNELALKAVRYLKEWNHKYRQKEVDELVWCHGHVYRKHVIHTTEDAYLIDFDRARYDAPARDLALFFRRHLDKAFQWEGGAIEWLEAYESEFPLKREDKLLLAIYLLFPERVFKEIEHYYQAVREWNPMKQARYVENQIQLTYYIRKFVREMLSN